MPYDAQRQNALNRMRQLENSWAQYPGRAPNGTGSTGLMSSDAHGWSDMLAEQQEYLKQRELANGGPGIGPKVNVVRPEHQGTPEHLSKSPFNPYQDAMSGLLSARSDVGKPQAQGSGAANDGTWRMQQIQGAQSKGQPEVKKRSPYESNDEYQQRGAGTKALRGLMGASGRWISM